MISRLLIRIHTEVKGEATVEYGFIIAVIAIICIGILLFINRGAGSNIDSNLTGYLRCSG